MTRPEENTTGYGNENLPAPSQLTSKQESFCQAVVSGMNQSDAYRHAYDTENMLPATISNNAYKLVNENDIATRIAQLREQITGSMAWDFERGMKEVETNITGARAEKQYAAANRGTEQALKLSGLLSDKPDSGSIQVTKVTVVLNHGNREDGGQLETIGPGYRVLPPDDSSD